MRQIMPIAGAVVGGMFGAPQLGFAIGSMIGNIVDPIEIQGRKLGDAPTQVAAEGGARAIVFGKGCVRAVVLMERGGRTVKKQRARGGKGGPKQEGDERAFWTYAIGIGEAIPGGAILRIWENEKLVYDVTPESTIPEDTAEFAKLFRFYDGSEDQLPDPAIEAIYTDPTDAPYYRGTAYMVFPQRDLTDFGEAVPTYRVEVATASVITGGNWNADDTSAQTLIIPGESLLTGTGLGIGTYYPTARSTHSAKGRKVYFEFYIEQLEGVGAIGPGVGFGDGTFSLGAASFGDSDFSWAWSPSGGLRRNVTESNPHNPFDARRSGQPWSEGDTLGVALDPISDKCWLSVNGVFGYVNNSVFTASTPGDESPNTWPITNAYSAHAPIFAAAKVHNLNGPMSRIVLRARASEFQYPIPAGFEPLGGSSSVVGDPVPLSSIIAALHARCGHASSDYDVSELPELIDGVVIESTQTGAEAINSLIGTHWADPADYDGKIRYIKRGAAVVRTLTIDDLIDEPETWQRNNAIEYPSKMHFFGQIADLAYASVKATSARYSADAKVVGEVSVSSPETFNDSTRPYEIAAILHKIMWTEAGGEVTWRVTDEHIDLVPTDCVGLSWAGQLWRARITQIEADPGELKLKMALDRQSAYTANLTAIPIPPAPTPPQTGIVSDTALAVLDIPALVDAADDLHLVTAMSGETDAWAGGTLQRSLDAGASFATVGSSTLNAVMGTLQAPVTAASPHYTDTTNAVEVLLYTDDEIEAISEQAFLSEGGAFALSWEDSGQQHWELMQYRDAELIAPKTYRLTTLHRGQLNTDPAAHAPGAMFVLLDAAIQRQAAQSAWIGTDLTHRAVSTGHTPDGADEQTLTYAGNSQREFPVANLLLSRAGDDVTAAAVPRHRFGTDDAPLRSLNWDGFRWTATDGANTVTRDGTADTETFDVTGWASPVTITVAQLNRITGAGPTVTEDIA